MISFRLAALVVFNWSGMFCAGKNVGCRDSRPLSPHLQIYRMPFNAVISVAQRLSGLVLYFALVASLWAVSFYLLSGRESGVGACLTRFFGGGFGKVTMSAGAVALIFHAVNGVKYVVLDLCAGRLFDISSRNNVASILVLLTTLLLSALFVVSIC
jgi:succinate dehydrogenase / fumarate reductase cytochrome b subunit